MRAIVLDIEGTTTPVSFVYETLFPYARQHLHAYLDRCGVSPQLFDRFREEHDSRRGGRSQRSGMERRSAAARLASIEAYAGWLMDRDRKSTALKELQGLIWEDGYRFGALEGAVFADVAAALARWRAGRRSTVAIFSSGSVLAQKLLFGFSTAGDLTPFIDRHFDTTTGAKTEAESYRRIAEAIRVSLLLRCCSSPTSRASSMRPRPPGCRSCLAIRPGNAPVTARIATASSFVRRARGVMVRSRG